MTTKREIIAGLENRIRSMESSLESADKEKTNLENKLQKAENEKAELEAKLRSANGKIVELEEKLKNTDYDELKEKAKQTAVEFQGLKDLYTEKIKEFEESKESQEEEFAKEAAVKRNNLEEEIQTNRSENQDMVSNTVKVFAGSYLYYMDQIRVMMDAVSQAAAETGSMLFEGNTEDIKERFGERIAEHLRNDVGELKQDTGDRLLIGASEEAPAEDNKSSEGE